MTDTIHKSPERATKGALRLKRTALVDVGPGPTSTDPAAQSPDRGPALRKASLCAVILVASYAAGMLAMRLAMHQGHGYQITPLSVIVFVALVLAFGVPEVLPAARRAQARLRATWRLAHPRGA